MFSNIVYLNSLLAFLLGHSAPEFLIMAVEEQISILEDIENVK